MRRLRFAVRLEIAKSRLKEAHEQVWHHSTLRRAYEETNEINHNRFLDDCGAHARQRDLRVRAGRREERRSGCGKASSCTSSSLGGMAASGCRAAGWACCAG